MAIADLRVSYLQVSYNAYNAPNDIREREGTKVMFVGREYELQALERLYDRGKFQMAVVYGRRRVGKTALLDEFSG